jgi:hypothetical protein
MGLSTLGADKATPRGRAKLLGPGQNLNYNKNGDAMPLIPVSICYPASDVSASGAFVFLNQF